MKHTYAVAHFDLTGELRLVTVQAENGLEALRQYVLGRENMGELCLEAAQEWTTLEEAVEYMLHDTQPVAVEEVQT